MMARRALTLLPFLLALQACGGADPDAPECGPETCVEGCCRFGVCIPAPRNDACGTLGTVCDACEQGSLCKEGACAEPASWFFQPLSATTTTIDPRDQLAWDADNSPPDVVVTLGCPLPDGSLQWTETEEVESYTPAWILGGCRASRADLLASGVEVRVTDVDILIDDTIDSFRLIITTEGFPSVNTYDTESRAQGLRSIKFSINSPQ